MLPELLKYMACACEIVSKSENRGDLMLPELLKYMEPIRTDEGILYRTIKREKDREIVFLTDETGKVKYRIECPIKK
jgi:hypothetical protein